VRAAPGRAGRFCAVKAQGGAASCGEDLCQLIYMFTLPAVALLGTIVGAEVGGERWHRTPLPARPTLWSDRPDRFALALSVQF
jgi:hypothetical protein